MADTTTTITITTQDRIDAENFLEQFLTDQMASTAGSGVDFSKGGAMRDFAVSAMANIFAYLRQEVDITRARQSLLLLGKLTGSDVDDAVDEILSNWFITRKTGHKSTGTITVYLTQSTTVAIPPMTRFYKTSALAFAPTSTETVVISTDDLSAYVNSDGVVTAYTFQLPVTAVDVGEDYDVDAGSFVDFTRFNPYISKVENTSRFAGGGGTESTTDMLNRAPTAISVRDLNSARSIDATLKDEITDVQDVTVIGYGDSEMVRDLVLEEATSSRIHAGGYADAYVKMPVALSQTFEAEVGGTFTDPRPAYTIFRDDTIIDFTQIGTGIDHIPAAPVIPGDILRVHNNLPQSEASLYVVKSVTPYGLYVSPRSPFPKALPTIVATASDGSLAYSAPKNYVTSAGAYVFSNSDVGKYIRVHKGGNANNVGTGIILSPVNTITNTVAVAGFTNHFATETGVTFSVESRIVSYSVGNNSPTYDNKISMERFNANPRPSGMFTKSVQKDGRVVLPSVPIYRITDVSIPGTGLPTGWLSADGRMHFDIRVNGEPTRPVSPTAGVFEYQVTCPNFREGYSGWQIFELDIAWPTAPEGKTYFNGKTVRVTYDTLVGYDSVWNLMVNDTRRITCGSVIPKGLHPVYLSMNVNYRLARTATADIDTAEAAQTLAEYINGFDTKENIDVSDISSFIRQTYTNIGYVAPLTINYTLYAPDGRAIAYQTTEVVSIDPDLEVESTPILPDPISLGVSDNTLRFLTAPDLLTFTNTGA